MTARLRARMHGDDGISLVEVMVGMSILMVALAAFASTLTQSLQTVSSDEQVLRANQLAAAVIEDARNAAFDCQGDMTCVMGEGELGFYADDPGYRNVAPDGGYTVTLGSTRPVGAAGQPAPGPLPQRTEVRDGVSYTITTDIVWIDDATQPGTQDYKELRVAVEGSVAGRAFRTSTSAARFDRPDPVVPCTPGDVVAFDIAPDFVQITSSGVTTQAVLVTVEMCSSTPQVLLTPTPLSQRNMTADPESDGRIFRIDDFPAGTTQFSPGEYVWTIDQGGHEATITFVEADPNVLSVIDIMGPASMCVDASSRALVADTGVSARIVGEDPAASITFSWTEPGGRQPAAFGDEDEYGVANYNTTIPAGTTFTGDTTTLTVTVVRSTDELTVTENETIPVVTTSTGTCP